MREMWRGNYRQCSFQMSNDLSQNSKYTILSSGGDTITLFWVQYLDKVGIQAWYFIQQPLFMNGRRASERNYISPISTSPKQFE